MSGLQTNRGLLGVNVIAESHDTDCVSPNLRHVTFKTTDNDPEEILDKVRKMVLGSEYAGLHFAHIPIILGLNLPQRTLTSRKNPPNLANFVPATLYLELPRDQRGLGFECHFGGFSKWIRPEI